MIDVTSPEISVERLAEMIDSLEATQAAAKAYIAKVEKQAADQAQQDADLITELRRQVATGERFIAQARRRARVQKTQTKVRKEP